MISKAGFAILLLSAVCASGAAVAQSQGSTSTDSLQRHYQAGESIVYMMQGLNESPQRTRRYRVRATGIVKQTGQEGISVEEFRWSDLQVNGSAVALSADSEQFREILSLDPRYKLKVPDLSKVQPMLIGPITDLLTFYADVQLAMRQNSMIHAGDHVYVKHGVPNSWADGFYTLVGQDSIDFDITLVSIDAASQTANLVIRHVPPAEPQVKLLADWMKAPVGPSANNWVQLQKLQDGKYAASVGCETFEARIKLDLRTGGILSANLDNPVDVVERDCDDQALTICAAATSYKIKREISLEAQAQP